MITLTAEQAQQIEETIMSAQWLLVGGPADGKG